MENVHDANGGGQAYVLSFLILTDSEYSSLTKKCLLHECSILEIKFQEQGVNTK